MKILIQLTILHNIFQYSTLNNLFDLIDTYRVLNSSFRSLGISDGRIHSLILLIKFLTGKEKYHLWINSKFTDPESGQLNDKEYKVIYISDLFYGQNISEYLIINEYKGIKYFHKENFETLLDWLFLFLSVGYFKEKKRDEKIFLSKIKAHYSFFSDIKDKAQTSGYNITKFKELLLGKNGKVKTQGRPVKKNAVKKKVVRRQK